MYKFVLILLAAMPLVATVNAQSNSKEVQKNTLEVNGRIFEKVEQEASFPGGQSAWVAYLQNNLKANVPVRKKAPVGNYQVYVRFIVAKDGKITGIQAESNHGFGMEKEVMRIIKKGPDWIPAMQNGRPVNAYRRQPVTFQVTDD